MWRNHKSFPSPVPFFSFFCHHLSSITAVLSRNRTSLLPEKSPHWKRQLACLPACLPALQPAFNKCLVGAHSVVYWYPKLREPLPCGVHTPGREQQCQQIHPVQSGDCNCGSKARAPRDPDPCPDLRKACSQSRLLGPTPG